MRSRIFLAALAALASSVSSARADDAPPPEPSRPLFTTSVVTLAASYGASALVGVAGIVGFLADPPILCGAERDSSPLAFNFGTRPCPQHRAAWMVIPIAGPFLYARASERDETFRPHGPPDASERTVLYATGAAQGAAILGLVIDAATRRPASKTAWMATPVPGGGAMMVGGAF